MNILKNVSETKALKRIKKNDLNKKTTNIGL